MKFSIVPALLLLALLTQVRAEDIFYQPNVAQAVLSQLNSVHQHANDQQVKQQ
jgi:hypothetical protein